MIQKVTVLIIEDERSICHCEDRGAEDVPVLQAPVRGRFHQLYAHQPVRAV